MDYYTEDMINEHIKLQKLLDYSLSSRLFSAWRISVDRRHFGGWSSFTSMVLTHLIDGHLETNFRDRKVEWESGDVLCLQPSVSRRTRIVSGEKAELEGVTIAFESFAGVDPLSFFTVTRLFTGNTAEKLAGLICKLREIKEDSSGNPFATAISGKSLCFQILDVIVSVSEPADDAMARAKGIDRLGPVLEYMTENFRQNLTIGGLAKKASLSRSRFHATFKETLGESPVLYIRRLKLQEASVLLLGTNKSIAEIADEVGLEDPFYFSRIFKNYHGVSPREYRRYENSAQI